MSLSGRYILLVDDDPGVLESYVQYLKGTAGGKALQALRSIRTDAGSGVLTADPSNVVPQGWDILTAESGEAAVSLAERVGKDGGQICVGFFDVKMPGGIDGIDTMFKILRLFPGMRCAVVSAYNDRSVDEINSLFEPGHRDCWDFISKPFSEAEVRQKVRMLSSLWNHADAERKALAELASMNAELERLVEERTRELQLAKERLANINEELQRALKQVEHLAITDPLTGLYNRRYFDEQLEREIGRAIRYGRPLCLVMFDLDHFKLVNDRYGHQTGDLVLERFAEILRKVTRNIDIMARIGGEEFALILPETNLEMAVEIANRVRCTQEIKGLHTTVSAGVAGLPDHGKSARSLLSQADKALYQAKSAGRNLVRMACGEDASSFTVQDVPDNV